MEVPQKLSIGAALQSCCWLAPTPNSPIFPATGGIFWQPQVSSRGKASQHRAAPKYRGFMGFPIPPSTFLAEPGKKKKKKKSQETPEIAVQLPK